MPDEELQRSTRQDLIELVAEEHGLSLSEAKATVDCVLRAIVTLTDSSAYLQISGFGRFENRQRAARKHSNPIQGGPTTLPARTVLWFTAAKGLAQVNKDDQDA